MSDITVTVTEGGVTVVTDTLGAATAAAAAAVSAAAAATSASNASTSASNAASSASAASTSASTATTQAGNASTSASAASSSASAAAGSASAASTSASNAATSASAASTSASNAATSASEAAASAAFLNPAAVAITGGTINGTAIGGTTPAAGAFTTLAAGNTAVSGTLSATGDVTLGVGASVVVGGNTSLYFDNDQSVIRGRATSGTRIQDSTGATIAQVTSTGLAVTGTLSATSASAVMTLNASPSNLATYYKVASDGGNYFIGAEGAAGGNLIVGSTAYALAINSESNRPVQIGVANALIGTFSSTALTLGTGVNLTLADGKAVAWGASNTYIQGSTAAGTLGAYVGATKCWEIDGTGSTSFSFSPLPSADNTINLGSASLGWKELFCDNGTINTSDARRKTEVSALSAAEINAAKQLAKEIGSFKFLAAVAEKGDAARNHIGMTVQRSIAIMEANGLNPFAYSFICHDAWDDEFAQEQTNVGQKVVKTRRVERQMTAERTESVTAIEMRDGMPTLVTKEIVKTDPVFHDILVCGEDGRAVMVVDQPATDAVLDDAGVEIEPARAATFKPLTHPVPTMEWVTESYEEDAPPTYVTVKVRDAGDKYSFRVHELLLFIAAGLEARMSALEVA